MRKGQYFPHCLNDLARYYRSTTGHPRADSLHRRAKTSYHSALFYGEPAGKRAHSVAVSGFAIAGRIPRACIFRDVRVTLNWI